MIVITGSYNGQNSLGDECLLKAVVDQLRSQRPEAEIVVHLHGVDTPFSRALATERGVRVRRGFQSAVWRAEGLLRRGRVPKGMARHLTAPISRWWGREAIKDLASAEAFFVFGGTQFAGQWYELNAPGYYRCAELVRRAGGRVFFGPQQYGPLTDLATSELRRVLSESASDWRTRNVWDAELLEPDPARREGRIVCDEVFGNTRLYPTRPPSRQPKHILLNLRGTSFDTDARLGNEEFRAIAQMVDRLSDRLALPVIFFAVSDATFCDDDAALAAVRGFSAEPGRYTSAGRVRDEFHLMDLAKEAAAVVSMSFHGCILSAIAGTPFIPVQEGRYYDYKYADFDKYTGHQCVPIIIMGSCDPARDSERIADYIDRFQPSRVERTRQNASRQLECFYRHALSKAA